MLKISDAARLAGVSAKLIRYYESIDLLTKADRQANGYRVYDARHVHELRFIKRARSLGFPIDEIHELLGLWRDKKRSSAKVRAVAKRHLANIEERRRAYQSILEVLDHLITNCRGDTRPECPILDELSKGPAKPLHKQKAMSPPTMLEFKALHSQGRRRKK